jgi:hypothetical protein
MTDRELLEAAARVAGLDVWPGIGFQDDKLFVAAKPDPSGKVTGVEWNPLTNDGDAFRLALACELTVGSYPNVRRSRAANLSVKVEEDYDGQGESAATRRAIVRAAAKLGDKNG